MAGVGYSNWNAFLRYNPVPNGLPSYVKDHLAMKRIDELVMKRLSATQGRQLELPLFLDDLS